MSEAQNTNENKCRERRNGIMMLIVGLIPFVVLIAQTLFAMIDGYAIPFFGNQTKSYGWDIGGFVALAMLFGYWYIFLPAGILALVGLTKIIKNKK
ncbi:hypothetical protein IJ847_01970 [Candidatus Saccharibacteria bacterium]|nr:hypothetical protein [Candidatus Saccharibacteria bacterium]